MKKIAIAVLLLIAAVFAHAADRYAPAGNTLADALQWLAVQTACLGQYSLAETGDFTSKDPDEQYRPFDIREYLSKLSGAQTKVSMFYGICFDYAQAAYNHITRNSAYYANLGVKAWYMAATWEDNPRVIRLFDPVSKGQHTTMFNGVYMKEASSHNVQHHGDSPMDHAWLWVYGNDGTIYWIDPTWTDIGGYVVWGVVRNGREEQVAPAVRLCAVRIPSGASFASFTSGEANRNQGNWNQAIEDYSKVIEVDPDYVIYNNRGLSYYRKGDYDKAIADFNKAIELKGDYAAAYCNRGLAYYAKGDLDRALADYSRSITLDPDDPAAFNGRAYVYLAKKDYKPAVADVVNACKLLPREAVYVTTHGEILLAMGNKQLARNRFELALRLSPNYTRAKELLQHAR